MSARASTAAPDSPAYARHFVPGSLRALYREKHPYGFTQTYTLMRRAFGYQLHYVNFGYWPQGLTTVEPGREATLLLGRALHLQPGERVIEGGSGLGQTAVDLCSAFSLAEVRGMNPCTPQVAFANELAAAEGLGDKVRHEVCDATEAVFDLQPGAWDHGVASECIGIFPDPQKFLRGLHRALRPGGRVAFTVVTSPKPAGRVQHEIGALFFGTRARAPSWWIEALTSAGFVDVERQDITAEVFPPMLQTVRRNLREQPELLGLAGPFAGAAIRLLIRSAERGVAAGTMGYELFSARRP
jgi:cyclopropane fatty-acyl-phospholipid synthase-like methyltransferase